MNWGWRVGKGVVSQVSLDQSITKRQQTDKRVKRTENITAFALEWCLYHQLYLQINIANSCTVIIAVFYFYFFKCHVCHVSMFVSTFISTLHMYMYYIETSVLLENIPLIKFVKNTSGTRVVYFP